MRYAVIFAGLVENVIELEPEALAERSVEIDGAPVVLPAFAIEGRTLVSLGNDGQAAPGWSYNGAFAPPAPIVAVPSDVPLWAVQAALKQQGAYDAIDAFLNGEGQKGTPAYFAWTMGNFASRGSTFIALLKAQIPGLTMTDADIDAVFIAAAAIAQVAS